MQYDAIALMSPFRQSLGTACTVLYCLLWDGSDGVLDRAGGTETTPASGCEIHGETETLVHDSDVHETVVTGQGLRVRRFRSGVHRAWFGCSLLRRFFVRLQDASHVPESFWKFAKDQGITGRRGPLRIRTQVTECGMVWFRRHLQKTVTDQRLKP